MLTTPTHETSTQSNARIVLDRFGGPDGLRLVDGEALPLPGPGQIRVRALAASVQFTDVIIRKGMYPDVKEKPPLTLGYDVVGEIDAIGEGVRGRALGDRVADMTVLGSYARHRLLDASRVVRVPRELDPAEAVSLVLSWTTAYQLLHRHARVAKGARVLIHGAAGAVGQALLELGRVHELEMFGTARAKHADLVASFGATPIDYEREDFTAVLDDGVDVVLDGIGEKGFSRSWSVVRPGGSLGAYGFSADVQAGTASLLRIGAYFARLAMWNALPNGKRAGFYSITRMRKKHPDWFREDLSALFELLRAGTIHPRIAERIRLADVADAHRRIEGGGLDGKLVIDPSLA